MAVLRFSFEIDLTNANGRTNFNETTIEIWSDHLISSLKGKLSEIEDDTGTEITLKDFEGNELYPNDSTL